MIISSVKDMIGNTATVLVEDAVKYYAKMEGLNLFGSVKDRAAKYLLEQAYEDAVIDNHTEIIESSSGNFGIALAGMCMITGNPFTCVIDPNIAAMNKQILTLLGANLLTSNIEDSNGNYVVGRIELVKEYVKRNSNVYWTNQYENAYVWQSYYHTLGKEICDEMDKLDYLFIAVSTCGTLAGTSRKVKERFPNCKIIAVDIAGSQIFVNDKRVKHISGIGAGFVPRNLSNAIYDDYMIVEEKEAILECKKLLTRGIIVGASSGAVAYAIQNYQKYKLHTEKSILGIFPDRGERYVDTIYCNEWYNNKIVN